MNAVCSTFRTLSSRAQSKNDNAPDWRACPSILRKRLTKHGANTCQKSKPARRRNCFRFRNAIALGTPPVARLESSKEHVGRAACKECAFTEIRGGVEARSDSSHPSSSKIFRRAVEVTHLGVPECCAASARELSIPGLLAGGRLGCYADVATLEFDSRLPAFPPTKSIAVSTSSQSQRMAPEEF